MTIMNQSSHLFQLQKIDTEHGRHSARLQQIEDALNENAALVEAQASVASSEAQLASAKQALDKIEEEIKKDRIKLQISESNLYGGLIKNPKELRDLEIEISSIKKRILSREDEQMAALLRVEEIENIHEQACKILDTVKARLIESQSTLNGEKSQLTKIVERLLKERQASTASITPENLAIYEQLRKTKRGTAVAFIQDDSCSSCGTNIRPAEIQTVRSSTGLSFCSTCGRILFAG